MQLDDFDFTLPPDLIALRPALPRRAARLLVARDDTIHDSGIAQLGDWLRPGDRLVCNDAKVISARLSGARIRAGGAVARIEVTLIERADMDLWRALARPAKRLATGDRIAFSPTLGADVEARDGGTVMLRFESGGADLDAAIEAVGQMPLPPYIAARREIDERDRTDYQTVFAARPGAVAAPTAGLHFDAELLEELAARGISRTQVTLHVGAGTFLPVTVCDIADHRIHGERGEIGEAAAAEIAGTMRAGGRVIAVGTTAARLLETAAPAPGRIEPWAGTTDIFIRPGYRFRAVGGLMTNFHLPKSTLLMLVSALMGIDRIRSIYQHAIRARYRFFSYGDGSLLLPDK